MCKLAHVIRYTVLSQSFHFCCYRATAYIRRWNWVQFIYLMSVIAVIWTDDLLKVDNAYDSSILGLFSCPKE